MEYLKAVIEEYGKEVLGHKDSHGNTLLHYAMVQLDARPQMQKIVCFLVDAGADLHVANVEGVTPLQMASSQAAGLLKAVADMRLLFRGERPETPLRLLPPPKVKTPYLQKLGKYRDNG